MSRGHSSPGEGGVVIVIMSWICSKFYLGN